MDFFIVDKHGEKDLLNKDEYVDKERIGKILDAINKLDEQKNNFIGNQNNDNDSGSEDFGILPKNAMDISHLIELPVKNEKTKLQIEMERFSELLMLIQKAKSLALNGKQCCLYETGGDDVLNEVHTNITKEMSSSVTKAIERKKSVPIESDKSKAKLNKIERSKTNGKNWFNLPATEMTEEVKRDLELIQMRSVLEPGHFYKKNDLKVLPKYFQVGTVLPSPLDYYNERGERKTKRKTIVDELMADAKFQRYNKRKYQETMADKMRNEGYRKKTKTPKIKTI